MKSIQCEPEEFGERIIFMWMFHEIEWRQNDTECIHNSSDVSKYVRRFLRGHWSCVRPGLEKTWYRTCTEKPNREWDKTATSVILQLATESVTQFFEQPVLVKEGSWIFQKYGKKSTRHSGNHRNIELLLGTIKSVNQLSVYDFNAHCSKNSEEEETSEAPSSDDSDRSGTQNANTDIGNTTITKRRLQCFTRMSATTRRILDRNKSSSTNQIHPSKQRRQNPNQEFEGGEEYEYAFEPKTGWTWYEEKQGDLPHTSSSSSSSWQNSSRQNWNSWWCHSSKSDEEQ